MKGKLSLVATPIGNLEDITLRAIRVLKEADYVLCEDTRVTGVLLKKYEIEAKLKRYDAHASEQTHLNVIDDIKSGKQIALVSDAGTPGVSDPGVLLVRQAREAGVSIEVIPGPSAVTSAFSLAGISGNQFTFLGFVPQKKGRETFFKGLSSYKEPVIFFESTHRILKTLVSLNDHLSNSKLYIARELTKIHEEMLIGTAGEILADLEAEPIRQKGEFVVIVDNP
ncbi:16S rRNA (cytidine(1402)-2'-O)-methyltransferase [Candidatus Kaiserbacteria bacterium]|nr:16S rRNA (cytidine(1402)-2'-O)-methyltransferase [Candidatus Kaiserbacteria bacterium]USN91800.1 MAG: 16S rRNA (cytidine(1402)-2'-O)-methyltransferase [Candidatus Nomurabacteria bacterium]